jgi:hypothetical protein
MNPHTPPTQARLNEQARFHEVTTSAVMARLTTENTEAHATIASLTTQLFAATKESERLRAILAVTETLSDPAMQKTKGEG